MEFLENIQIWLKGTEFYDKFLLHMPAPLNNVYFDAIIVFVLIIFAAYKVFDSIQVSKRHRAVKERQLELKEKQAENEIDALNREKESRAQREEMNQFMKVMEMSLLGNTMNNTVNSLNKPQIDDNSTSRKAIEENPEDKAKIAEMEYKYTHDKLTGVKNADAYMDAIENLAVEGLCVISVDVNGLKGMNDNFGHRYGDALLKAVGEGLIDVFGADVSYRRGGDEFTVLLEDTGSIPAENMISRFRGILSEKTEEYRQHPDLSGDFIVSAAVGYAIGRGDKSMRVLLDEADKNMYLDKEAIKKVVNFPLSYREQEAIRLSKEVEELKEAQKVSNDIAEEKIKEVIAEYERREEDYKNKINSIESDREAEKKAFDEKISSIESSYKAEINQKEQDILALKEKSNDAISDEERNRLLEQIKKLETGIAIANAEKESAVNSVKEEAEQVFKSQNEEIERLQTDLQKEKDDKNTKITEYNTKLEETKKASEEREENLKTQIETLQSTVENVTVRAENAENNARKLADDLSSKDKELSDMRSSIESIKAQNENDRASREEQIEMLKKMLEQEKASNVNNDEASNERILALENALSEAQELNKKIIQEKEEDNKKYLEQVETYKNTITDIQNKANNLADELERTKEASSAEIKEIQDRLDEATALSEEDRQEREAKIAELNEELRLARTSVVTNDAEKESKIKELEKELAAANVLNNELNAASEAKISELTKNLDDAYAQSNRVVAEKQAEIDSLNARLIKEADNSDKDEEIARLNREILEINESHDAEVDILNNAIASLQSKVEASNRANAERDEEIAKMQQMLAEKELNSNEKDDEFEKLKSQIEVLKKDKEKSASNEAQYKATIANLQEQIKQSDEDNTSDIEKKKEEIKVIEETKKPAFSPSPVAKGTVSSSAAKPSFGKKTSSNETEFDKLMEQFNGYQQTITKVENEELEKDKMAKENLANLSEKLVVEADVIDNREIHKENPDVSDAIAIQKEKVLEAARKEEERKRKLAENGGKKILFGWKS